MSQNVPPNEPRNPYRQPGDSPQPEPQPVPEGDRGSYYSAQGERPVPDLDANAPQLKSSELQRLNRKAMVFLAGIVALLAVMAIWIFSSAGSSTRQVDKPREETVVVPELPRGSSMAAPTPAEAAEPIEVVDYSEPALPPLPPEPADSQDYAPSGLAPQNPRPPSLMDRRMQNSAEGQSGADQAVPGSANDPYVQAMLAQLPGNQAAVPSTTAVKTAATSAQFIKKPDALMVRGTYIRCVLETRIITDVDGFTSCIVTEPVYSINGRSLLLPKGSKLLGQYGSDDVSRDRVSVIWDRITTPNGLDVSMASPGVDNLGSAGHPGKRNAHWGSRIGSALLISLLSDGFKYAGQKNGPGTTTTFGNGFVVERPFESNTARAVQRLADQAVADSASRGATVTINQGTIVNVYVSQDVDFSGVLASN